VLSNRPRYGISASITPLTAPRVRGGHIAAWVGVGGEGLGPNGSDAWLQTGISAEKPGDLTLYYEYVRPGGSPQYAAVRTHLSVGRTYRVAVAESRRISELWAAFLDGERISPWIWLPGSHGAWRPVVTAESWNGEIGACNTFSFRFDSIFSVATPGGSWAPMEASPIVTPLVRVSDRTDSGFVATGSNTSPAQ
jgi:hypothetical protein